MSTLAESSVDSLPISGKSAKELRAFGTQRHLSLSDPEWTAIQTHFKSLKREPSLAELETIAQTWSEHCKHKTFTSPIKYTEGKKTRAIKNLFQERHVRYAA